MYEFENANPLKNIIHTIHAPFFPPTTFPIYYFISKAFIESHKTVS